MRLPERAYCSNCKGVVAYKAERLERDGKVIVDISCPDCHWIIATFYETALAPVRPVRAARRRIRRTTAKA